MGKNEDFEIIREVLNGNANAFGRLVKKYERMIYNLALSRLGSRENAEDLTQECFLRAYIMLRSYKACAAFSTWIYKMCRNLIYDFQRAGKKKSEAEVPLYIECAGGEVRGREIADCSAEPCALILRDEQIREVRTLIADLPDDLRDIIIMREINNLSYAEIALALNIEIGTVKSRIYRAREKLKRIMLDKYALL